MEKINVSKITITDIIALAYVKGYVSGVKRKEQDLDYENYVQTKEFILKDMLHIK